MYILYSVLVLLVLSVGLGVMIVFFAKVFEVKVDPRIELINEVLPAYNCGACGYPGCINYATALVEDNVAKNKCGPGGKEVADKIEEILKENN